MCDTALQIPIGNQRNDIYSRHFEFHLLEMFLGLERYRLYPLEELTHATSQNSRSAILKEKLLRGGGTPEPYWSMLSEADTEVRGVWFCSTLYKGRRPDISPYGNRRFVFSARDLLDADTLLFYDTTYYFHHSPQNQYVRFVAVKSHQKELHWCYKNLTLINKSLGLFFSQEEDGTIFALQNNEGTVNFWLEVLVLGDVSLVHNGWEEDTVGQGWRSEGGTCAKGICPALYTRLNHLIYSRHSRQKHVDLL